MQQVSVYTEMGTIKRKSRNRIERPDFPERVRPRDCADMGFLDRRTARLKVLGGNSAGNTIDSEPSGVNRIVLPWLRHQLDMLCHRVREFRPSQKSIKSYPAL